MIGARLKLARSAEGLSMKELGEKADLSATAISKFERNKTTPTSKTLIRLAQALNTRTDFFLQPEPQPLGDVEFRKRSSLSKKVENQIRADVTVNLDRFRRLLSVFPQSPVPAFSIPSGFPETLKSYGEVESTAEHLREVWGLGGDAIQNLMDALEDQGFVIITTQVHADSRFDGLATTVDGTPVLVVGKDVPVERQRFTLAHELGHIVLHGRLSDDLDEEKACNRFAGALLLPAAALRNELGARRSNLRNIELMALKEEYGISMAAALYRAKDTGVIDEAYAKSCWIQFGKNGWRKNEPPSSRPPEHPKVFDRLLIRAVAEDMLSLSKAAELKGISALALQKEMQVRPLAGEHDGSDGTA